MSITKPIPVSSLSGPALDWVVAGLEGTPREIVPTAENPSKFFTFAAGYSSDWSLAGPIIERELIQIVPHFLPAGSRRPVGVWEWGAYLLGPSNIDGCCEMTGPTPLIAAMRCYVASRLGNTVQIPEELL
jgi:hypothetical protein